MAKKLVANLEGGELSYWVAQAQGLRVEFELINEAKHAIIFIDTAYFKGDRRIFNPHEDWSDGGPIIESEKITIESPTNISGWCAYVDGDDDGNSLGKTPLIAAMRAFVKSKFGEYVDIG
jgi:hypothetical protein